MTAKLEHILEVRNLSNRYEGVPLIQDVSFFLQKGEILCLLGPSGAGKTTLLRLIAGLEKAEFGSLLFANRNIRHVPPHKRNFGMMFQDYALFPHKNVWQNVAFGLEMKKCRLPEKAKKVDEILGVVGLTGFEQRKIDELSGGERQRVALARSLASEPKLLLLDEPFGSLDRSLRERLTIEVRDILTTLKVTAILVTHDQTEAFTVADKVAVLHDGILQQFATPQELYRHPTNKTVANFLGFRNIVIGDLDKSGLFSSTLGNFQLFKQEQTPRRSYLLIRPDAAQLYTSREFKEDKFHLECEIRACQFVGNRFKVTVMSKGNRLIFDLPLDPPPPEQGEKVILKLNPLAFTLLDETI